ncbi:MAG: HNH endonuclease [Burkholderiales bacterium]|nr:HNH endonuclease [Burkholderiales bacterium]
MRNVTFEIECKVFERDKGYCRYCGADLLHTLSLFRSYTMDHVISLASRGESIEKNLVLCCVGCNNALSRSKHLQTVEERKKKVLLQRKKASVRFRELKEKLRIKKPR